MKIQEENIDYILLITKSLSNEATTDECAMLEEWKQSDPDNLNLYNDYCKTWQELCKLSQLNPINIDIEWNKISSVIDESEKENPKIVQLHKKEKSGLSSNLLRIAAVALILIISSIGIYMFRTKSNDVQLISQNSILDTQLPDQSLVTLNVNSSIVYPKEFDKNKREVELNGSAYFEIERNPSKPFVINTSGLVVEVLGTSFYIDGSNIEKNIEVIVNTGKVAVYHKNKPNEIIYLEAGSKCIFNKTDNSINPSTNNDKNFLSWKTKHIVFENTVLTNILETLNKVYGVNLYITSKELNNCTVTGTFNNKSIDFILDRIKESMEDLSVIKTEKGIELSGSGC